MVADRFQTTATTTVTIESTWQNREVVKTDASVETLPLVRRDIACSPPPPCYASTQTEVSAEERLSARGILISKDCVNALLDAIDDARNTAHLFERLETFHRTDELRLALFRRTPIEEAADLPISSLKCGRNARTAILFGYRAHESWCSHVGKVIITQRSRNYSIPLGSCPTQVAFGQQQQVIIATASGEMLVTFEGETLWQSDTIHAEAVTSFRWVSPQLLLSAGLDGRLVLSSLNSTSLEAVRSTAIAVSDLPRSLRRNNATSRRTGIVGITGSGRRDVFLAGETGALWSLDADSLSVSAIGADPEGIEQVYYVGDSFVTVSAAHKLRSTTRDGLSHADLSPGVTVEADLAISGDTILMIDSTKSTAGPIIGFSIEKGEEILRYEDGKFLAIAVNDDNEVIAVDEQMQLNVLQFV
uniref:WD_REPEATS_REGION domain-containing protein n=1 Tax=Panagrellus redivivus TaxID=6233 RepID=A0A7E4W269_PANRE